MTQSKTNVGPDEWLWLRDTSRGPRVIEHLQRERESYEREFVRLEGLYRRLHAEATSMVAPQEAGVRWSVGDAEFWYEYTQGAEFPQLRRLYGGREEIVLDLNELAGESSYCRLAFCEVSPDGKYLAYAVDTQGDESYILHVRRLEGRDGDVVVTDGVYYGSAWASDGGAFWFLRHDHSYRPHELWRFVVDSSMREPELIHREPDASFHLTLRGAREGIVLSAASRLTSEEWFVESSGSTCSLIQISPRVVGHSYCSTPIRRQGRLEFLIVSDSRGADFALCHATEYPSYPSAWVTVLDEVPGRRLVRVEAFGGWILVEARRDAQSFVIRLQLDRPDDSIEISSSFPDGNLHLSTGIIDEDREVAVAQESYLDPPSIVAVDIETGDRRELWRRSFRGYDRSRFTSERGTATARDGTPIPYLVVRHVETPLDGTAPCLLYGYGAWETVIEPSFDPALVSLLRRGVVLVHAFVRGGGELGRSWWLNGRMEKKVNSFTDFIDVGEHLGATIVDAKRIVIRGRSAGGLLVGAALSLRPDLWAGVIAEVPFVDPITTMSDPDAPLVVVEWDEWGDPRRERDLRWMKEWAPFHNVPPLAVRPRVVVTATLHDSRVSIWEPARWVAKMRSTGSSTSDLMFRANVGEGAHAVPEGRFLGVAYTCELFAWLLDAVGEVDAAPHR